jgi:hypothetical protein
VAVAVAVAVSVSGARVRRPYPATPAETMIPSTTEKASRVMTNCTELPVRFQVRPGHWHSRTTLSFRKNVNMVRDQDMTASCDRLSRPPSAHEARENRHGGADSCRTEAAISSSYFVQETESNRESPTLAHRSEPEEITLKLVPGACEKSSNPALRVSPADLLVLWSYTSQVSILEPIGNKTGMIRGDNWSGILHKNEICFVGVDRS